MYYGAYGMRSGLGFSLLPPRNVRTAVANIFNAAVGAGERAATMAINQAVPSPADQSAQQLIQQVPGGLGTIGVVALVGLGLLLLSRRR